MKQLMGGRQRPKYRLSPNEVEQLKKEETERRRKLRIVQVREQSKAAAAKIRQNVKQERKRQLVKLAHEVESELEKEQQEQVRKLEQQYDNTLRTIGQGHTQAILTDKKICTAEKRILAHKNQERAQERHKEALRKLALDKAYQEYEETQHLRDRQAALMGEKKRSAEVAARPPPPPDPISDALLGKNKMKKPVPLTDLNAFSATHYHVPDFAVEKAAPEQQHDGKAAGEEENQRTREEISERRKKEHDQLIRALIRGNEALKKEKLKHDFDALMADLSVQQRADRRQRQLVVAKLPKQVFLPPDRRMEELDDKQMEMERAFEDMYMQQMNLSGDLSLTLDPNPLTQTPVDNSLEAGEDSPVIIPTMPAFNPALKELTNVSRTQGQTVQQEKPDTVLKKLLNKIKEQRSDVDAEEMQVNTGQENLDSKSHRQETGKDSASHRKDMSDAEPDFAAARIPISRPSADPQLDLSPLKAPGNQKPQKSQDMGQQDDLEESSSDLTDDGEAGFLQQLQQRLQAIEVQKDHLDRLMRDRQHQHQHHQQSPFPTDLPDSRPQPSTVPQRSAQFPASSAAPHQLPQVSTSLYPGQSTLTLSGGPAGDVGVTVGTRMKKAGNQDPLAQPHSIAEIRPTVQTYSSLSSQNVRPAFLDSSRQPVGEGQSGIGSARPVGPMSLGSGYPDSSSTLARLSGTDLFQSSLGCPQAVPATGSGLVSMSGAVSSALQVGISRGVGSSALKGSGQFQTGVSYPPPYLSSMHPGSTFGSAQSGPAAGFATLSTGGGTPWGAQASLAGGLQFPSSYPSQPSSMLQPHTKEVARFSATQPSLQSTNVAGARDSQPAFLSTALGSSHTQSSKPSGDSLASRLAAGGSEEERLQRLREYQHQLIVKHQERMKALQDTRASIEARQAQASGQGVSGGLSASQRLTDPASLVPYTLRTSLLQSQPSAVSASSAFSTLPATTLTSSSASFLLSSAVDGHEGLSLHGANRLVGSRETGLSSLLHPAPSSARVTTPLSSVESAGVLASMEPILAGSAGVPVSAEPKTAPSGPGVQPLTVSDGGDRPPTSGSNGASKLDSVRKSLPFDDLDDTLHRRQAEGEAGGDTDGASMADDSHLSSSTERGSPALGSRSNKSSTSGKSGSGLSAMSDGSLGGSSLVARAEEKRLSFEQRQRELQYQLAEIQRQKDALLQRYHGNQQRVSAQEESLRSKLKTAKEAASSSSAPASLSYQPVSAAVSLGVHQSASPSMELEERSLSSERLSAGRSWAFELEEYSISHKSGDSAFKSPASMTLEEVSITSERSGGTARDVSKVTNRSANETRPGSSLSSLEEYSIVSGKHSTEGAEGFIQPSLSVRGSQESQSARRTPADPAPLDHPDSGRGRLDIRDLMHEFGGGRGGAPSWLGVLSSEQLLQEEEETDLATLPPPPTRQPVTITDYEPHELSTILEVDTPQTANKTTASRVSSTVPTTAGEGTERPTTRRYIDFRRHGTATEDDRNSESKFSASGSSASSDVRSVIEVRTGILKSGETASTTGSGEDTSFSLRWDERRFRENILESSPMKGTTVPMMQGAGRLDPQPVPSQEMSYASSGQGFQSLELTLDSLTPRSVSVEESQARRYLDFSGKDSGEEGRGGGEHVDDVLRQARQFNQDLLAAIQRQSADVFDQSSLSSLSKAVADHSHTSQQSAQDYSHLQ